MEKLQKVALNTSDHVPGVVPKADSFVRRKSSEIRKLLPKSPRKAVTIVKHLWNQLYRSPRKRKLIDNMWSHDTEMGKFMYKWESIELRKTRRN